MSREQQLAKAFVGLADTLTEEFDPLSLFHRLVTGCVELLDVDAAAVMMADARGSLRTMAASRDEAAFLELLQLQTGTGPCVDSYRTGLAVAIPDIAREWERWPQLVSAAAQVGFRSVHTVPLRLHARIIGAVNLFRTPAGDLPDEHRDLAQSLADAAALALVHWSYEPLTPDDILTRVQAAITAKAILETAKGMVAEYAGVSIAEASAVLHDHARRNHTRLTDIAWELTTRTIDLGAILEHGRT